MTSPLYNENTDNCLHSSLLFNFAVDADTDARNLSKKKLIEDLKAAKGTIFEPSDCIAVVNNWEADRLLVANFLKALKDNEKLKVTVIFMLSYLFNLQVIIEYRTSIRSGHKVGSEAR